MRRIRYAVVGTLAATLLLGACGSGDSGGSSGSGSSDGEGFPMTVSDCGRKVVLERRPERVLTSGSSAATLMWAAGATDRIVTRASEGGAPLGPATKALADIPQISTADDLSREVIIGQSPDLVISAGLNATTAEDLDAAGIPSLVNAGFCDGTGSGPNPDGDIDFDDVYADITLYGRIFGTSDKAAAKVRELERRVAAVHGEAGRYGVKRAAAILVDGRSVTAYGRLSMTHTQIGTLGLDDVFGDLGPRINEINVETLIERNPEVLIVMYDGQGVAAKDPAQVRADLRALPGADQVDAIREDRIVTLEAPYLLGSPLAVDGLEKMAAELTARK